MNTLTTASKALATDHSSTAGSGSMGSRIPYLDGLRVISIALVIMGHTLWSNSWLSSKWYLQVFLANAQLGVRIFFVLSGFLITTLLLNEESANGSISLRGFYERRIARIFPAFYLYIAVIGVLTASHVMRVPMSSFLAAGTYTWNLMMLRPSGIVDPTGLFVHTWTLSIEEQFYLVWPGILVLLGRRWALRFALICIALFPLIRLTVFLFLPSGGQRDAILTETAQDVIMWGCVGAFAAEKGLVVRLRARRVQLLDPLVCSVLFIGLGGLGLAHIVPGFKYFALPTLESLATLLFVFWLLCGNGGLARKGLEARPVVGLGLISYSLYIWQEPFTFWPGLSWLRFPWNALLPVVVAFASYKLVEVPMRKMIRKWFTQPEPVH